MTPTTVKAKLLAINAHQGQFRKITKDQYIIHILRILEHIEKKLGTHPKIQEIKTIAALHDLLEDTWVTKEDLEKEFNQEIVQDVLSLSKKNELPKKIREEEYKERLKISSENAKIVKLFDIYDNLHTIKPGYDNEKWLASVKKMEQNLTVLEFKDKKFEEVKKELIKELTPLIKKLKKQLISA